MDEDNLPVEADDTATRTASGPPAALERIGPYVLLHKIGEGGMGDVWEAQQEEPIRRSGAPHRLHAPPRRQLSVSPRLLRDLAREPAARPCPFGSRQPPRHRPQRPERPTEEAGRGGVLSKVEGDGHPEFEDLVRRYGEPWYRGDEVDDEWPAPTVKGEMP